MAEVDRAWDVLDEQSINNRIRRAWAGDGGQGDWSVAIAAMQDLGDFRVGQGRKEEALKRYQGALALARVCGPDLDLARQDLEFRIESVRVPLDFSLKEEALIEREKRAREEGTLEEQAMLLRDWGDFHIMQGQPGVAQTDYTRCLALVRIFGPKYADEEKKLRLKLKLLDIDR